MPPSDPSRSLVERIWEDVSGRVGDDLRVVTQYRGSNYETKLRDDVREMYTTDEDRTIIDDTIVSQLMLSESESKLKTGALEGTIRVFEDAWILSWIDCRPKKSGIIVSIQRDGETASIADVEWCLRYLEEEIAPLLDESESE